ncbi:AQJ64_40280 family protein [Streptomyces sp. NPDC004533]|uniref:AQJ64_40280 family protein n=1 Tax=Streptomyces sp. NPDC004533 TaxID=3154278 RepID=UPI0033A33519
MWRVGPSVRVRVEMTNPNTAVTWVDARERLPRSGTPVAAAITGRYPADSATQSAADAADAADTASGEEFWLVRPMVFMTLHWSEDGAQHRDCFVDSDGVVRLPYGRTSAESVTHWAQLPTLPGRTTHLVLGEDVQSALQNAWTLTAPPEPQRTLLRACPALPMHPRPGHDPVQCVPGPHEFVNVLGGLAALQRRPIESGIGIALAERVDAGQQLRERATGQARRVRTGRRARRPGRGHGLATPSPWRTA